MNTTTTFEYIHLIIGSTDGRLRASLARIADRRWNMSSTRLDTWLAGSVSEAKARAVGAAQYFGVAQHPRGRPKSAPAPTPLADRARTPRSLLWR
jgi:hypothetical protein